MGDEWKIQISVLQELEIRKMPRFVRFSSKQSEKLKILEIEFLNKICIVGFVSNSRFQI